MIDDKALMDRINLVWEIWRGTEEAQRLFDLNVHTTTIALHFTRYYVRYIEKNG